MNLTAYSKDAVDFTDTQEGKLTTRQAADPQKETPKPAETNTSQPESQNETTITSGTVFMKGVTADSGWWDANKTPGDPDTGIETCNYLCRAGATSNVMQWWQDDYKRKWGTLPASIPDGVVNEPLNNNERNASAIFNKFKYGPCRNTAGDTKMGVNVYALGKRKISSTTTRIA